MAATGAGPEAAPAAPTSATVEPQGELAGAFDGAHGRYKAAYAALRGLL